MATRSAMRWARLAALGLAGASVVLGALLGPPWFRALVSDTSQRRLRATVLLIAPPAYGVLWVVDVVALVVLARVVVRARKTRTPRPLAAKLLLLSGSVLVALLVAEGTAGVARALRRQGGPWPTLPTTFEAAPAGEATIAVIGESSARGLPFERWVSPGHIVAWQLGRMLPGARIRLDVLADPGIRLEAMHTKLAGYRRRPDVLIIYAGHNEFTSRDNWSRGVTHYRDALPTRPGRSLGEIARRVSPLCRTLQEAADAAGLGDPPPSQVTRALVDVPCCRPDEYDERRDDYARRLEAIVAHCERVGTLAVVVVPPANDADFEPNRSYLDPATPRDARRAFEARFRAALALEATDPARAIEAHRALIAAHPEFAEAHYRLGRLLARRGDREGAYREFVVARDRDGMPFRCPSDFQDACRAVARRHPRAAILVDGQAVCRAASPTGLLDDHLFIDAMHPNLDGQCVLAAAILDALRARRALGWPGATPTPRVEPAEVARHFGIDARAWAVIADWGARFYALTAYIRHDPTERLDRIRRFRDAARRIADGAPPGSVGLPGIGTPSRSGGRGRGGQDADQEPHVRLGLLGRDPLIAEVPGGELDGGVVAERRRGRALGRADGAGELVEGRLVALVLQQPLRALQLRREDPRPDDPQCDHAADQHQAERELVEEGGRELPRRRLAQQLLDAAGPGVPVLVAVVEDVLAAPGPEREVVDVGALVVEADGHVVAELPLRLLAEVRGQVGDVLDLLPLAVDDRDRHPGRGVAGGGGEAEEGREAEQAEATGHGRDSRGVGSRPVA